MGFLNGAGNVVTGNALSHATVYTTAIPEPETYALLMAGLAFVAGHRAAASAGSKRIHRAKGPPRRAFCIPAARNRSVCTGNEALFAGPRQRRPAESKVHACHRHRQPQGRQRQEHAGDHLAACFANRGVAVMLGDVDRQQSTQGWLRMRGNQAPATSAPIVGWAVDPKRVLRPPAGVSLVVLDTPGGLHGFDLARVASFADVILMPVCNSAFDRESAADCHAELMALPRVASGRCKVAAVGMRLDARTRAAETLASWAADRKLPFVAALRETQVYVRGIERGLTLFRSAGRQERARTSRSRSRSSIGSSRSWPSCASRRFVAMPR